MPRSGSGTYSLPAGSIVTDGVDDILASQHNTPLQDLAADANLARPVAAGGTGATTAADALVNFGLTATAAEINALDGVTATGTALVRAADAAAARTAFGATSVGSSVITAADASAARTAIGATTVGNSLFTATNTAAARNALELAPVATAQFATQAQAEAGTANNVPVTPLGVEQHMLAHALGWGQALVNVTATRAANTSYRNETGRPIQVSAQTSSASGSHQWQTSTDGATWVVAQGTSSNAGTNASFIVPHLSFYRFSGTTANINHWSELR